MIVLRLDDKPQPHSASLSPEIPGRTHLFVLLLSTLRLRRATVFLGPVLPLLALLSGCLLSLRGHAESHQAVLGLESLHRLVGVVDERETGRLAATVLCSETEDGDLVFLRLVEFAELLSEFVLGDGGAAGVEDIAVKGPFVSELILPDQRVAGLKRTSKANANLQDHLLPA